MVQEIVVKLKDVYGMTKVYPVCENAKHFADLAGTRTLTRATRNRIQLIGFNILLEAGDVNALRNAE